MPSKDLTRNGSVRPYGRGRGAACSIRGTARGRFGTPADRGSGLLPANETPTQPRTGRLRKNTISTPSYQSGNLRVHGSTRTRSSSTAARSNMGLAPPLQSQPLVDQLATHLTDPFSSLPTDDQLAAATTAANPLAQSINDTPAAATAANSPIEQPNDKPAAAATNPLPQQSSDKQADITANPLSSPSIVIQPSTPTTKFIGAVQSSPQTGDFIITKEKRQQPRDLVINVQPFDNAARSDSAYR